MVDPRHECPASGLRVLVVDDDRDTTATLALLLRQNGHETRWCGDGFAALRLALDWQPDAILLDLSIPFMDGYEVAAQLRAGRLSPQPFIIAISGFAREEDKKRSRKAGVDLHLEKPADLELLFAFLSQLHPARSRGQHAGDR